MTPIQFANQPPTPTLGRYTGDAAQRALARAVSRTFRPVRYRGGYRSRGSCDRCHVAARCLQIPQSECPWIQSMDEGDMAANLNAPAGAPSLPCGEW
jgi:hypothetical protein